MICTHCGASISQEERFCTKCGCEITSSESKIVPSLLKRAMQFVEEGEWGKADDYCERVLDIEPENARAFVIKLMIRTQVNSEEGLASAKILFGDWNCYKNACRYADDTLRTRLEGYLFQVQEARRLEGEENERQERLRLEQERISKQEELYHRACQCSKDSATITELTEAVECFSKIQDYKDAYQRRCSCVKRLEELKEKDRQRLYELEQQIRKSRKRKGIIVVFVMLILMIGPVCLISWVNASHQKRAEIILNNLEGMTFSGTCRESYTYADITVVTSQKSTLHFMGDGSVSIQEDTTNQTYGFVSFEHNPNQSWSSPIKTVHGCKVEISFFGTATIEVDDKVYEIVVDNQDVPINLIYDNNRYGKTE